MINYRQKIQMLGSLGTYSENQNSIAVRGGVEYFPMLQKLGGAPGL